VTDFDHDAYRLASHEQWDRSAAGWRSRRASLQRIAMPVSRWLIDAIRPQPGQRVLELAAGPGDTGFLAAELLEPGGGLICSDASEAMLGVARERARELGLENVEFRPIDAEAIELPTASVDGVLCRWGYMLLADPGASLRETRRVLTPGGRVALAAWDAPEHNPWTSLANEELQRVSGAPSPQPGRPGMFAFAPTGRIEDLLQDAGFAEIELATVEVVFAHESFDAWWEDRRALARPFDDALRSLDPAQVEALQTALAERLSTYTDPAGRLEIPGRTLVAAASA